MNFWDTVTGNDLTREWKAFDARAEALPPDYREAWAQIKSHLFPYAGFTGRNLMPIFDAALGLLEESAAEGLIIADVLGDVGNSDIDGSSGSSDIGGFCAALAGGEGARTYRDRWRAQLNRNVARKLSRLGG